ncbi:MAG TPA: hypothetical protein VNE38_15225 [Ktedonobacteraceae bacterium]|nr:hypothetical protein [Ktedonobacteraceae bacterium]
MNTEVYEWLGIIYPVDVKANVAFITPLAYFDKIVWRAIKPDIRRQYFPHNGKATLFAKDDTDSKIGRFCTFFPERNSHPNVPEDSRYSLYMVHDELQLSSLAQIIDLTNKASNSFEIPDLLDRGFEPAQCFTQHIYIRHQDYLYGPIRLEPKGDKVRPREYIDSTDTGGPSLVVLKYRMPEEGILKLGEIVQTYNYLDDYFLETPVGKEDFSLPQVAIKRALQASNELPANVEENVRLVDKRIRELIRLSSSQGPAALHIEEATLNRAHHIMQHQMHLLNNLKTLFEDVSVDHPLLKIARDQEIRLRNAEIDREIAAQTQGKRGMLQQLEQDIQEAEIKLETIRDAAEAAEKQRDQAIEVEHEVQRRLTELREEPLHMLAEFQIASSFFPALSGNGQPPSVGSSQSGITTQDQHAISQFVKAEHTIVWQDNNGSKVISSSLQDLPKPVWVQTAQSVGVLSKNVRIGVAAFLAGFIPVIAGEAVSALLYAVARIITGGRTWSISVPLTATSPLDLFGSIERERRIFIPAAGGLADIVLEAQKHPQELALLVLEGIDRVPGLPVSVPLLQQYHEIRQATGTILRPSPINLFHPRAIEQQDPYRELAQFIWPDNLLLAVTCDSEAYSLRLPSICNPWLIPVQATETKPRADTPSHIPPISQVPFNIWRIWQQEARRQAALLPETLLLTSHQRMFYHLLTILKAPESDKAIAQIWPGLIEKEASNR